MKIFALVGLLLVGSAHTIATNQHLSPSMPEPLTVTALIAEPIMPVARGEKYGQPLDSYLGGLGIGEVVGAGTALSATGGPAWVEIVFELTGPETSIEMIARKLHELGAPEGSHLYYYVGEERRQVPIK